MTLNEARFKLWKPISAAFTSKSSAAQKTWWEEVMSEALPLEGMTSVIGIISEAMLCPLWCMTLPDLLELA
jgi:hypothetical protein